MRSNSFDEMNRMFDQMDRTFDSLRRRFGDADAGIGGIESWTGSNVAGSLEAADDGYRLVADLPGFEKEELDLAVRDGVLRLSAVHEVEGEQTTRTRRVDERVTLPADADGDAATATYRNGVLEVAIPFREDREDDHRIDID